MHWWQEGYSQTIILSDVNLAVWLTCQYEVSGEKMPCLLILGCAPQLQCRFCGFLFLSLEVVLLKSQALNPQKKRFGVWLEDTHRIFQCQGLIKKKCKTLHIYCINSYKLPAVAYDFGFLFLRAAGSPCCSHELIFSPFCLSWAILLSNAKRDPFGKQSCVAYLYDQLELQTSRGKSKGDDRNPKTC